MKILFVCTGNICRSPMAAAYFSHLCKQHNLADMEVMSAGVAAEIGLPMSMNARKTIENAGVKISADADSSTPVDRGLVHDADLIVVMSWRHQHWLAGKYPEARDKTHKLLSFSGQDADVNDPFGGDEVEYQACFNCMKPALAQLLRRIQMNHAGNN